MYFIFHYHRIVGDLNQLLRTISINFLADQKKLMRQFLGGIDFGETWVIYVLSWSFVDHQEYF